MSRAASVISRGRGVVRLGLFAGLTVLHGECLALAARRRRLDAGSQARITQEWGGAICRALGIRVERAGDRPEGAVLLVANHRSYADVAALAACAPMAFIAKAEIQRWPLLGRAATHAGTIFVSRGDAQSGAGALRRMRAALAAGVSIAVFPEGTTCASPSIGAFQPGAFRLAAAGGIPVVPVAIEYARASDAWTDPDDRTFAAHFITCFGRRQVAVRIAFGPRLVGGQADALRADAHRWIEAHLVAPREEPDALSI